MVIFALRERFLLVRALDLLQQLLLQFSAIGHLSIIAHVQGLAHRTSAQKLLVSLSLVENRVRSYSS